MKRMRKCNDEIYQLAKDKALAKKFRKNDLGLIFISVTTIQVGKRTKDIKESVFGSASIKHYIQRA
jgi:hypothetical protein